MLWQHLATRTCCVLHQPCFVNATLATGKINQLGSLNWDVQPAPLRVGAIEVRVPSRLQCVQPRRRYEAVPEDLDQRESRYVLAETQLTIMS